MPGHSRSASVTSRWAVEVGLEFRPIADSIRDTLRWAKTERGDRPFARTGVKPDKEKQVLLAWHLAQRK